MLCILAQVYATVDTGSSVDVQGAVTQMGVELGYCFAVIIGVGVALILAKKSYGALSVWIDLEGMAEDRNNRRIIQDNYDRMYEKKRKGLISSREYRDWYMQDEKEYEAWWDARETERKSRRR